VKEIKNGITVETLDGRKLGESSNAAVAAVAQVVPSRVGMAGDNTKYFLLPIASIN
jgi:hypothetical protein